MSWIWKSVISPMTFWLLIKTLQNLITTEIIGFTSNVKKLIKILNNAKKNWQTSKNPNDKTILNIRKAFKDYSDKLWKEKLEDLQTDDGSFWNHTKYFKSS
ncbi:hypothetical protein CEXT_623881 [Caerostris extrusa]|uniref:Uncharacterized protein n=1 Tax=Caerostris extrusa TaxID=172846 RepID=A0AAV4MGN4_CAEEX|nr:hypothetical protein CEXT_623881 [Caerostris extrusa]